MLEEKEKQEIRLGFKNVRIILDRILNVLEIFERNKDFIEMLIDVRYPQDRLNYPLLKFLDKKADLNVVIDKFAQPINIEDTINEQFKTFLKSEVTKYYSERKHLMQKYIVDKVCSFLDKQQCGSLSITPDDNEAINYIFEIPRCYLRYIEELEKLYSEIFIFEQIKNITGSIVMIGANGSGKSTFARQLNGKLARNIVSLTAQPFLYYHKSDTISVSDTDIKKVQSFQLDKKMQTDGDVFKNLVISDMDNLVNALIAQHVDCALGLYDNNNHSDSILNKTLRIWGAIIEHRQIKLKNKSLVVSGADIKDYGLNQLSDGEKAVLYFIAHVLFAPPNSYIIVDEPENHLHVTICNRLWDKLESVRSDCKFIYLTHNLSFATNRENSTVIWNKEFRPPYYWDFEILPENDIIPEQLVMEIVGSRRNICFCEGNYSSIDYKLYSVLFPQYTVIPVSGHRNVINYVNAYNTTTSFVTKSFGIIDGDHHIHEQICKWKKQGIYTLPINEIENILCDEVILKKAIDSFCVEGDAIDQFHQLFWDLLSNEKEKQAANYVNEVLNIRFSSNFLHEKNDVEAIIKELQEITTEGSIRELYENTLKKINDYIDRRDYSAALKFVNFKGRLTNDIAKRVIVDKFVSRVIFLIKKSDELQRYIIDTYFNELNNVIAF